ncbi:MAG: hypothetical protein FJY29_12265 [Betaproteobacteria bacterium]|nr:hypothetical protein [Betaproteobacteria bacterium]
MNQRTTIDGRMLRDFLLDLRTMHFTGSVKFSCSEGQKNVFLQGGEITHCNSNLLDDRLGDVIYREGRISLDLFVELAGKVNERFRFGDLLVQTGLLNMTDLWEALVLQSKEILTSLSLYPTLDIEVSGIEKLKTPDLGLRFRWDQTLDECEEDNRHIRLFEAAARQSPALKIDERARPLAKTDFLKDMLTLVEQHKDFTTIIDEKSRLSKIYTLKAIFKMYAMGIIVDTWNLHAQDLPKAAENELQEVVGSANKVFLLMEAVFIEKNLTGWDVAVNRAIRILESEFGAGVQLIPNHGFVIQQLHKVIALNRDFKLRARGSMANRWPVSVVTLVQEGLHKALLYLLFELSNNRGFEEDARRIHAELVSTRGSYFSRVAEAIS